MKLLCGSGALGDDSGATIRARGASPEARQPIAAAQYHDDDPQFRMLKSARPFEGCPAQVAETGPSDAGKKAQQRQT